MWSVGGATRIYLLAGVTDLRRGFDGCSFSNGMRGFRPWLLQIG